MKKRIALVAAVAMAIAVGGMVPASAKLGAPAVASDSCGRAGTSLEIKEAEGTISVKVDANGKLVLDVTDVGADPVDCSGVNLALAGLTSVIFKATSEDDGDFGQVIFDLEGSTNDTLANYKGVSFTVQAESRLKFDGDGLDATNRGVNATVTEEAFSLGSLVGTYYAAELKFVGSAGDDVFDASTVTTTPVDAEGGTGDDSLKGGAEDDTLEGGTDEDKLYGNAGDDMLDADDNGSTVITLGKKKTRTVTLPSGSDEAWGGAGADDIEADEPDIVAPGDGIDEISLSGAGTTLYYGDSTAAITVNLSAVADSGSGTVVSTAGNDYFQGGRPGGVIGSGFADTLVGHATAADEFYGEAGDDTIDGLGGDDYIEGGAGDDAIEGGAGGDEIYGDGGNDTIVGEDGDDDIFGGGGDDAIKGGTGDDTVNMGGGADITYGSAGKDVLRGKGGKDQAWGGRGSDLCAAEVTDSCEFVK